MLVIGAVAALWIASIQRGIVFYWGLGLAVAAGAVLGALASAEQGQQEQHPERATVS